MVVLLPTPLPRRHPAHQREEQDLTPTSGRCTCGAWRTQGSSQGRSRRSLQTPLG